MRWSNLCSARVKQQESSRNYASDFHFVWDASPLLLHHFVLSPLGRLDLDLAFLVLCLLPMFYNAALFEQDFL